MRYFKDPVEVEAEYLNSAINKKEILTVQAETPEPPGVGTRDPSANRSRH